MQWRVGTIARCPVVTTFLTVLQNIWPSALFWALQHMNSQRVPRWFQNRNRLGILYRCFEKKTAGIKKQNWWEMSAWGWTPILTWNIHCESAGCKTSMPAILRNTGFVVIDQKMIPEKSILNFIFSARNVGWYCQNKLHDISYMS